MIRGHGTYLGLDPTRAGAQQLPLGPVDERALPLRLLEQCRRVESPLFGTNSLLLESQ